MPDTKSSRRLDIKKDPKAYNEEGDPLVSKPMKDELKKELKERISILCVAYHNLGVQ